LILGVQKETTVDVEVFRELVLVVAQDKLAVVLAVVALARQRSCTIQLSSSKARDPAQHHNSNPQDR